MSDLFRRPALHIGLPRTGTTTLQTHLFSRHSQIEYLGIYKGRIATRETRRLQKCRDSSVAALMRELVFENHSSPDLATAENEWEILKSTAEDRLPLWSHEMLSTAHPKLGRVRAQNLKDVLGPSQVLMTLRSPVSLMESCYFQVTRDANRLSEDGKRAPHIPIDKWFETTVGTNMAPLLDYEATLNVYLEVFGEGSVTVLLFEDLADDQNAHVRRICDVLKIDRQEGEHLVQDQLENATSASLIRAFRYLSRFPGGARLASFLAGRNQMNSHRRQHERETRLSEANRARIVELTGPGNQRISSRFGLDLKSHGYPM